MVYLSKISERLSELMFEKEIDSKSLAHALGVYVTTVRGWKRGAKYLRLKDLLSLADYFNCSLDFITKRTEKQLDYIPKACPPLYERLRSVMSEKGKTAYQMERETKIKDSYLSKWKHRQSVHILSLIEIADYLEVSLDYLVGRDR